MSRFNLIDEKWIPVRFFDGTRDELGIRDTLLRAEEIAAIEDSSPLVVASLHRFLLAVLYRALEGPTDIDQAKELFKKGLPDNKIIDYLNKWQDRFWLFDEKYPFYQVPSYEPKEKNGKKQWRSWTAMASEHNADNAKVLFDHVEIENAGTIFSKKAAQWLIACQTFAVGGGNSDFQYTKSAPSASAVMAIPLGANLHDTLLLSLVPENREILVSDNPIWEREPEPIESLRQGPTREDSGWADRYSWRSRSIRLNLADEGEKVAELVFASGIGCVSEDRIDPMLGYRIDDKKGKLPVQFRERGFWRDFDSLLPDETHLAPKVIEHAVALTRSNPHRFPRSVMILGQANNKAKIEFWRMERFVFPTALAGNKCIRSDIRRFLENAEQTQKALWSACSSYARNLLSRGDRKPESKDISGFVSQMPSISWYWSALESRFRAVLQAYTLEKNTDEIELEWLQGVRNALKDAWEQHRASVSTGDAWAIRALVKAEGRISGKIKELNESIVDFKKSLNKENI
jgi:CRISPR system Cascade subunit CasA